MLDNVNAFQRYIEAGFVFLALHVPARTVFVHATHMNETNVVVLNGARLKLARKAAGLNQTELAHRCGVVQSHISGMERGVRAPSIEMLDTLSSGAR